MTQAIPGSRAGGSSLPWIVAVPLAYLGLTFAISVVKTSRKFNSPREKRRKLTGFDMSEILRKYIRYVLNDKPFNPELIANLIHLRRETQLDDYQVAGILNEISGRIVKDKAHWLRISFFVIEQLPEFCSSDSSLNVKMTFGVTDEDAEKLRLHTISEFGDLGSLEKMIGESDEESNDDSDKAS